MWSDERWKVARCCGAKHIWKSKWQNTTFSDHFWKLWCWKSARRCGAKHISKSKVLKTWRVQSTFGSWDVEKIARSCGTKHISKPKCTLLEVEFLKKCTPLWREAHFEVKSAKNWGARSTFGRSDVVLRGRRRGLCTLSKVSKTLGFCSSFKNDGRRGTFEEDLERRISHGRRSTRDTWGRFRRSGRRFPESGCILEHQIVSFGKMILCDRCSTSYDLASLFRGRRNTLDRWSGQIAKRIGKRPSALHSTFHLWRKSRRIASFLILPTWKIEEVSQSRRIAWFLTLSTSKTEEVSQNCCVFDVVKFKNWGSLAE